MQKKASRIGGTVAVVSNRDNDMPDDIVLWKNQTLISRFMIWMKQLKNTNKHL